MRYFQNLFTSSDPSNLNDLLDGLMPRVTETNRELIKTVTLEEIRRAAFSIKGSYVTGADGMNGVFFQSYWSVVGGQVIRDVKNLFKTDYLSHKWNFTQLVLLPKEQNPRNDRAETNQPMLSLV